jgi:protein associated with RNAse G/E
MNVSSTTGGDSRPDPPRLFYRKEKLRGACWEYEIAGGWLNVTCDSQPRNVLRHAFSFYRPRDATIRTGSGIEVVQRAAAEQWFFPDRWFSLLRFTTANDRSIGYYVNFSRPLREVRRNYYSDIDLELDLWLDLDGTVTELDRDEFEHEITLARLPPEWAAEVNDAAHRVLEAVAWCIERFGPDVEKTRDPQFGIPEFILRA